MPGEPSVPNRLASESSPYLLQHKDNPVDWYPWGDEAFDRAQRENKPVFVSIGYAACHWCHVMERESFENESTAALMNELFVNIKVDREERPDVDAVYMHAIHLTGQGGGWPLSAFCTPRGEPFHLGTYYPPDDRYGRPGFPRVLRLVAKAHAEEPEKIVNVTKEILDGLKRIDRPKKAEPFTLGEGSAQALIDAGRGLVRHIDPIHGGFGSAPKFPSSPSHGFLARASRLPTGEPAREAFLHQARKMARGGIFDHVGGGFARYSVDDRWLVPHFEKMLYDNAQLLSIYAKAYAMTGDVEFRETIEKTLTWLEREMLHESGGLYASQDADSEGEEGVYYVWTPTQVAEVLDGDIISDFSHAFGVTEFGNFENKTTVLSRVTERGDDVLEGKLCEALEKLLEARRKRVPPDTDTKVLSSWNGLAITGLVRAWEATGSEPALRIAQQVGEFLLREVVEGGGRRLYRVWKDGKRKLEGTLEDYAFVAEGFMALAEAIEDRTWWDTARNLLFVILDRFYEEHDDVGVFYMSPAEGQDHLIHRPVSARDNATPAGAAVAIDCLVRLALGAEEARALAVAENYFKVALGAAKESPFGSSRLLSAFDMYLHGTQVVITNGERREALLRALRSTFAPTKMMAGPWTAPALMEGKQPNAQGLARAYVCRGQTCSAPLTLPDALTQELTQQPRTKGDAHD